MDDKKTKRKNILKVAIISVLAILIFLISIFMNVIGFSQTMNPEETNKSGIIGFSLPSNKDSKKEEEVKSDVIEEVGIKVNSMVIVNLKNNGWDRIKANFKNFEMDLDGNCTFKEGYKFYCNNTLVNYIVFNSTYKDKVMGDIYVGTSLEDVKKVLGEPSFKEENMIGYKTGEVYAFFYNDEIVIYPNKEIASNDFENFIFNYYQGLYDGNRTNFVVEFRNKYQDFKVEADGNDVILTSLIRQVKIRLIEKTGMEITVYNGYNTGKMMSKYLLEENNTKNVKKDKMDLVLINELERKNT
ncbi:MAG: hypothetical protein HFJ57_07440 [Clostridia bacterium]|nr:hypothetical protein [Clostridia bacterium]MCI9287765.1 hypothetical protein [Clostridia bacterium]